MFSTRLYTHQKEGLVFIHKNLVQNGHGAILADFMGLGKSLQVVSFVNLLKNSGLSKTENCAVVIVCPKTVISHWEMEFAKFNKWIHEEEEYFKNRKSVGFKRKFSSVNDMKEKKKVFVDISPQYSGPPSVEEITNKVKNKSVILLTYSKFRNLMINGNLSEDVFQGAILILDEGHKIRTDEKLSKVSEAFGKITSTRKRLVLTGYPLQNNLFEYFFMVRFALGNNFFSSKENFKRFVVDSIVAGEKSDAEESDKIKSNAIARVLFHELKPYVLRRKSNLMEAELGLSKKEYVVYLPMSKVQKELYNDFIKLTDNVDGSLLFWRYICLGLLCVHPLVLKEYFSTKMDSIDNADYFDSPPPAVYEKLDKVSKELFNEEKYKDSSLLDTLAISPKMATVFKIIFSCKEVNEKVVVFSKSLPSISFIQKLIDLYNENLHVGEDDF